MFNRRSILIICAVGLLALPSCVKEARHSCPCWLDVDFSDMAVEVKDSHLSVWGENQLLQDAYTLDTLYRTVEVGRELVVATAVSGLTNCTFDGGIILCKEGNEYDAIMGQSSLIDCRSEEGYFRPSPNKQYAQVRLRVLDEGIVDLNYNLEVVGDICGLNMRSMTPISGAYRQELTTTEGNYVFDFRLPRLTKESKTIINLYHKGEKVDDFPLYDYINRAGYDWQKPSLDDIEIVMDRVESNITIIVKNWETGEDYIITL